MRFITATVALIGGIASCTAQLMTPTTTCPANVWKGTDYPGNDIKSFSLTTNDANAQVSQCCTSCSTTAGCAGFIVHDSTCWLKSKMANATPFATAYAGFISTAASTCPAAISQGTDYPNNDIKSFSLTTNDVNSQVSQCCAACSTTAGCAGFIVHDSTCWLKSKMLNATPFPSAYAGFISTPAPTCAATISQGTDYPNNDIKSFSLTTNDVNSQVSQCCAACSTTAGCAGFHRASNVDVVRGSSPRWPTQRHFLRLMQASFRHQPQRQQLPQALAQLQSRKARTTQTMISRASV
ncbi:hypothetical protein THRCLA_22590 [Thraustotheca clavata]|uniref:Apple domain-containing protein n=1 Tax=Thraustotheca clavata TaxID=74557 RepID=A0A1V9YW96_9STRA|nr:hypothetical protein THRCLA_22590 [Thraustotheca clavata]